jgi:hypothetical protein
VLDAQKPRFPRRFLAIAAIVTVASIAAVVFWLRRPVPGIGELPRRLENRGRVLVVGDPELTRVRAEGSVLVHEDQSGLSALLDGTDDRAFTEALTEAGFGAILADQRVGGELGEAPNLRERLTHFGSFDTLACDYLTPTAALYEPRMGLVIDPPLDEALAHVARAILSGARQPRVQSFPEALRRIRNVEVMVMLEDRGHPRLWRSARGSSIARALLTAATVARQRWSERQAAMGGPIDLVLPTLDVSVYLLDEDGTLGSRSPAFVDRVFSPEHGVAFDHRGTWRYFLPDATREEGEGSAVRAYRALFVDSDMAEDSLGRDDVRAYRMLARRLAVSPAPVASRPSPLPPIDPVGSGGSAVDPLEGWAMPGADDTR